MFFIGHQPGYPGTLVPRAPTFFNQPYTRGPEISSSPVPFTSWLCAVDVWKIELFPNLMLIYTCLCVSSCLFSMLSLADLWQSLLPLSRGWRDISVRRHVMSIVIGVYFIGDIIFRTRRIVKKKSTHAGSKNCWAQLKALVIQARPTVRASMYA